MIEVFEGDKEDHPKYTIEYELDVLKPTVSISSLYNRISEVIFAETDEMSHGDYESIMYVYLPVGDIWMNCGLTPPSKEI